jgi:ArsR family transcriptional regulator
LTYILAGVNIQAVKLLRIYECLCDQTRLRLINLLQQGPLCVCHLQSVLGESQVKVSKHLRYLKTHGLVESRKEGYWRIYQLPARPGPALAANLRCLQDCVGEDPIFRRDLTALKKLRRNWSCADGACVPATLQTA